MVLLISVRNEHDGNRKKLNLGSNCSLRLMTSIKCASIVALSWLMTSSLFADDERPSEIETLQAGVKISLVAEHPDLSTPTGIDVDEQGRIWLVATHTHFRPDDYVGPEHDEILVFKDTNGDGKADSRTVFYNATESTMDLELGLDGWVYLAERDRILRIKDTNGDGKADVEENVLELETEADYPHNGLEGLAWHPNGDLVFGLGENFSKPWTITGVDGVTITGTGEGGIFRCRPDGSKLHRIAKGFWNPFGICVRKDGEIFAAENDPGELPPCRLLHVVEGGDYGYQRSYGPEAHHPFVAWNGELRGTLPMIHPTGEAPCGVQPLGRGLLVPSWSDHRIDFFSLRQKGASYAADRIALVQGSRYFRPSCISRGRSVDDSKQVWYLSDWVDGRYQSHGYGRVWKLEIDTKKADWIDDLELESRTVESKLVDDLRDGKYSNDSQKLLELSLSQDPFIARIALLQLAKETPKWKPSEVSTWLVENRVQAVLALKTVNASPKLWVKTFLNDQSSDVLFETLRWIADKNLKSYLPDVAAILNRSDLSYSNFEAAIATLNTLNGKSENGVRNPELLLARVQDDQSDPQLRAFALRMLPTQPRSAPKEGAAPVRNFSEGLTLELLHKLLEVDDPTLSHEVIQTLSGNPLVSQKLLRDIATDSSQDPLLRTEAVVGLAAAVEQNVDVLLSLVEDKERIVREEALRGLRSGTRSAEELDLLKTLVARYPESSDLFQAILNPASLTTGRPPLAKTEEWLQLLDAVKSPADPATGKRIFHHTRIAQCTNCHRHHGRGNVVGPDLSAVSHGKGKTWLLQSVLEPSREMAPEYLPRSVLLKDGTVFTGIRLRSYTKETIRDTNGQNRTFDRNEIESMVESTISFMPVGLTNTLTIRELRDLIAFLETDQSQQ